MKKYIALLKGINVGGHKKVPMADLKELLIKSGFQNVQTYIQSGNIVLQSSKKAEDVQKDIQKAIQAHFGFEVSVIVKTNEELQDIFDACPFSKEEKEKSYFIMLSAIPTSELVEEAKKNTYDNEEIFIKEDRIYFFCANGYGKAKFNMNTFERKLNVVGTSRNYNTMVKLLSLSA